VSGTRIEAEVEERREGDATTHRDGLSIRQIELLDLIVHLVDPALKQRGVILLESFVSSRRVVQFEVESRDFVVEDLSKGIERVGGELRALRRRAQMGTEFGYTR